MQIPKYYWGELNDAISGSALFKFNPKIKSLTSSDGGVDYSDIKNVTVVPLK